VALIGFQVCSKRELIFSEVVQGSIAEKESIVCRERRRSCSLVVKKFKAVTKKRVVRVLGYIFRSKKIIFLKKKRS
jgi:hypothetical protein